MERTVRPDMQDPPHSTRVSFCDSLGLDTWARQRADAAALSAPERPPLSYGALAKFLESIRGQVLDTALERDEVVALVLPSCAELATAILAVTDLAACATLDPAYTAQEFHRSLERLRARTLIVLDPQSPAVEAAASLGIQAFCLKPEMSEGAGVFALERISSVASPGCGRRTDAALLFFTSATTGEPKIVPKDPVRMMKAIWHDMVTLDLGTSDRLLLMMPLYHIHGLTCLFAQLMAGGETMVTRGFDAASVLDWLRDYRPTWYTGSAPVHNAMLSMARQFSAWKQEFPLRFIRSTGPLQDPSLLVNLEEATGASVLNGYGVTECNGITRSTLVHRKPGSVGKPRLLEVAIMDESGRLLPAGEEGEVVARGPSVMSGYLDQPEATAEILRDGWLHTGDVGRFDADGFLFLIGRIKEFINRGGKKILPGEVDAVLLQHPAVADVATFAAPHPTLVEDVAAAVVLRPGASAGVEELRQAAASQLAPFKVPRRIFFVPKIPRNVSGKPMRTALTKEFGQAAAQAGTAALSAMERQIAAIWKDVLHRDAIGASDDFFSLGGDSLSATIMLNQVQQVFHVQEDLVGRADFLDTPTIQHLSAILESAGAVALDQAAVSQERAHVVRFERRGSRTPILCFPAAVAGLPIYFKDLARSLGTDPPFWAVKAPDAVQDGQLHSIEELATISVQAIREALPNGPYWIAGHCYGATLAYEVTRRLIASGAHVPLLLMFDAGAPGYPKVIRNWKRYWNALRHPPNGKEALEHAATLGRLFWRPLTGRAGRALAAAGSDQMLRGTDPRFNSGMAMWEYKPQPLDVPIVHLIAKDQVISTRVLDDPRHGWREWARAGITLREVPGDHFSMFSPENAPGLAEEVREVLRPARVAVAG